MSMRLRGHPHDREIRRLAIPALGALAAEPLYVLVDTAVVGHLGTPQLGGLAVAAVVLNTSFWIFNFLAYGTTAAVARLVGADDREAAAHQGAQGLWLAAGLGAALVIVGVLAAPAAVGLVGASETVRPFAITYLRISALGAPAVLVALVGLGYLRGVQDTRTTLAVAVGSNVLNLVLELVLIYGLGMGVGASAAATVFAQWCAALVYAAIVLRQVLSAGVSRRPDARRIRALLVVGRDLFIRTGSLLGALAVATSVASRLGAVTLGGHQIAFQVWNFLALVLDAVAIAGQAMIGRLLGAGDADDARSAGRRMIEWGVVAGVVVGLVVLAIRVPLASVFSSDPAVVHAARRVLIVVGILQPINAVVFVLDGVLIGAGDLRYLAAAMVTSGLVVFVPAALVVLHFRLGLVWLWGALTLLMLTRLVGNVSRFAGDRWQVLGRERDSRRA